MKLKFLNKYNPKEEKTPFNLNNDPESSDRVEERFVF